MAIGSPARRALTALDRDATVAIEPALRPIARELVGAIYFPDDEHGDAFRYCEVPGEARHATRRDVSLRRPPSPLSKRAASGSPPCAPRRAPFRVESVVVAAGSYSPQLLEPAGSGSLSHPSRATRFRCRFRRGCQRREFPFSTTSCTRSPCRLATSLRLAGTAEFTGHDRTLPPARIENLVHLLSRTYPEIAARVPRERIVPWTGLRPMSCGRCADHESHADRESLSQYRSRAARLDDGVGSGRALADLVMGRAPGIDLAPYALARFN